MLNKVKSALGGEKLFTVSIIALAIFILPTFVVAQGKQQGQGGQQAGTGNRGIETATQNLNRVVERNNNPETGEQIRSMLQNHEEVQTRTKTALHQMSQRNQAVKFMIGPDYKNAGQVRSDVVGLRNDISKLEQIREQSLPADVGDVQGAIDELQVEADGLETELTQQLSGFSLFGWLAKLLAK
jgi:hypothetical protein